MSSRQECNGCRYYVVVSGHIIVNSKPFKTCSLGELPETCKRQDKK